jgi:hypothetical protein
MSQRISKAISQPVSHRSTSVSYSVISYSKQKVKSKTGRNIYLQHCHLATWYYTHVVQATALLIVIKVVATSGVRGDATKVTHQGGMTRRHARGT